MDNLDQFITNVFQYSTGFPPAVHVAASTIGYYLSYLNIFLDISTLFTIFSFVFVIEIFFFLTRNYMASIVIAGVLGVMYLFS